KRRTLGGSGRERKDMSSMNTIRGRMYNGTPLGTNTLKKWNPCLMKPYVRTVKNTVSASAAVIIIWLVTLKVCGIRLIMFSVNMNMNSVNTNGKNLIPSGPAVL